MSRRVLGLHFSPEILSIDAKSAFILLRPYHNAVLPFQIFGDGEALSLESRLLDNFLVGRADVRIVFVTLPA